MQRIQEETILDFYSKMNKFNKELLLILNKNLTEYSASFDPSIHEVPSQFNILLISPSEKIDVSTYKLQGPFVARIEIYCEYKPKFLWKKPYYQVYFTCVYENKNKIVKSFTIKTGKDGFNYDGTELKSIQNTIKVESLEFIKRISYN
jgi:hypothetical protein